MFIYYLLIQDFDAWFNAENLSEEDAIVKRLHAVSVYLNALRQQTIYFLMRNSMEVLKSIFKQILKASSARITVFWLKYYSWIIYVCFLPK